MNIHHLELFYYVARHGGISEAVRNIPYGIQQPAVSGQVAQLEEYLGVILFQRRPFGLSPAGEKLYRFIYPFFSNLGVVAGELQGGQPRLIRIGASTIVLRDHLPEFFRNVRKKYPHLKISLREGYQAELESLLQREELDLAVTVIEKKIRPGNSLTGPAGVAVGLARGKGFRPAFRGRLVALRQDCATAHLPARGGDHLQTFSARPQPFGRRLVYRN